MAKGSRCKSTLTAIRTYEDLERHRRDGKEGCTIKDHNVKGLTYQRQGASIFARARATEKGTGKHKNFSRSIRPFEQIRAEAIARGETLPQAKSCVAAEEELERIRAEARTFINACKLGLPLAAEEEPATKGRTMRELVEAYEKVTHAHLKPKTAHDQHRYTKRFVLPRFGDRAVASITRAELEELHAEMRETPYQANRVKSLLSSMFTKAVDWGWRADNPAKGIKWYHEEARTEWYRPDEMSAVLDAARELGTPSARAIELIALTGARPSEVLGATWDMFDLEAGTWTKPSSHVKQKRTHHVYLNEPALEVLRTMHEEAGRPLAGYVFPSPFNPQRPLKEIKRAWNRIVQMAGVRRLTIYEGTRHSHASILINAGEDPFRVGKQLGHVQLKTTKRYAHLADETQRQTSERFAALTDGKRDGTAS